MDEDRFLALARHVMSLPTAPFAECFVAAAARQFARERGLVCRDLADGNLLLLHDGRPSRRGRGSYLVATAHMDHPGLQWCDALSGREAVFEVLGGVETRYTDGAGVCLFRRDRPADQRPLTGRVVGSMEASGPRRLAVRLPSVPAARQLGPLAFGMWRLTPWALRGRRIHGRACDDVGGVAVGLAFLDELDAQRAPVRAGLLLTRAEEVGFVGMLAAQAAGDLDPSAVYVNIECSSTRAGAVQGGGPVVRVGDRLWTFDPAVTGGLAAIAEDLAGEDPAFRYQRRLMDSGACEATVLMSAGCHTGAVALPLGNYHNAGEGRLAAETIHVDDALGLVRLLVRAAQTPGGPERASARSQAALERRLGERFRTWRGRLHAP